MYRFARSLLFLFNPETVHNMTMTMMGAGARTGLLNKVISPVPDAPVRVMGLEFPNPVGLAAGLDKDGECINAFGQLGFGFIEVGTVTPVGQPGNPKPRVFRLVENKAIINRMGFNNKGVDSLVNNLKKAKTKAVIGVNIGKNKDTPLEKANDDYLACLRKVYPWAGYVAVNLSSPNTPGLRELQFGEHLSSLLVALKNEQTVLTKQHHRYVPIAIKLAPDMADDELREIAQQIVAHGMDAIIATNTTLEREEVAKHKYGQEQGGLSGAPLTKLSTEKVRVLAEAVDGRIPIIGVGGIMCAADAIDKIRAGASLVQIYTGFIYRGPELVREVAEAVSGELKRMGRTGLDAELEQVASKKEEAVVVEAAKAEEPKVEEQPKPVEIEKEEPAVVEAVKAEEPKAVETEKAEPVVVAAVKAEEPKAVEIEKEKPVVVAAPKVEEPKAVVEIEKEEPVVVAAVKAEEPKAVEVEKEEPAVVAEAAKIEEPKAVEIEKEEPVVVEAPKVEEPKAVEIENEDAAVVKAVTAATEPRPAKSGRRQGKKKASKRGF